MTARHMTIAYRRFDDYEPVDLDALRPAGSYAQLIRNRTHAIDALVAEHGRIPDDLLIPRNCPTCASAAAVGELSKDHMQLVRCTSCDLVYVSPAFDEHHYRQVYASADYQRIMKDLGIQSHEYRVRRFGRERVDIMARYLRAGADTSYLDVGCSSGFAVEAARDRGWRAIGIDLNPSAVEFGRTRGLDLRLEALENAEFAEASFDAISLFDVLEHLLSPVETLRRTVRLLKPGGIVFLYVPNYDSASRLLMGSEAHFIWPSHHLNYYTPITLSDLLAREALTVEFVSTEGLDFADYLWYQREVLGADTAPLEPIADRLQFLANAGGYGKNLRALARR
jgi:SAM-dependent methyltransferase